MNTIANEQLRSLYATLIKTLNSRRVSVVGLGRTAFARSGFYGLVDDFRILCVKESADLECIRQSFPVLSVEKDFGVAKLDKQNTSALLSVPGVKQHVAEIDPPVFLFVYKSSPSIEALIQDWQVELLSSKSEIRKDFENKWDFRRLAKEAGLDLIQGQQLLIDDLDQSAFATLKQELGDRLVFQITDYSVGGGIGTFFINTQEDFEEFKGYVSRRREAGRELEKVNVTRFIEGESASIAACVTRYGTLTGRVQRQLIDFREVVGFYGRNGVFAGHEWGDFYAEEIHTKAVSIAQKLGDFMFTKGYRGIFGIDLVVNHETNEVALIECNSRYTGAFPVYTMLQKKVGEIPLDLWHLLEFYHLDYEMDFDLVQESYATPKYGAQLVLHNLERAWVEVGQTVKPGVYSFASGKPVYQRCGFELNDLQSDDELVLTDGIPFKGEVIKPGNRIGRFLFSRPVTIDNGKTLDPLIKSTIESLYQEFQLQKIDNPNATDDED